MTKMARILELMAEGRSAKEIEEITGFSRSYINNVKYWKKHKMLPSTRKPGRPKGSRNKPSHAPDQIIYIGNPRPNLWARIKAVFTGRYE